MPDQAPRLLVTGAAGQLGQLVVEQLLDRVPAARIVAAVRRPDAIPHLAARGVEIRVADYDQPDTLRAAFAGIGRVLLVSSNALGRRVAQHRAAIEAAARAGIELLAYTSVLHADTSTLGLAAEHRDTETILRASGVPFALLRNGWYTENYTAAFPAALAHGALLGGAREGRIASAARADYAAAAVAVLTADPAPDGPVLDQVLELAGDAAYTLAELAAEAARQSGRPVAYVDLPEAEHRAALLAAGLPDGLAALLADSDAAAAGGALFDDGRQLSALIGRPTTPMAASVAAALAGC